MTLKKYLIIMISSTILSSLIWLYVVWLVNPKETNLVGYVLFYSTLFVTLTGIFAIIGLLFRSIINRKEMIFRSVKAAFRQSFLFSILIIASLVLLSLNLFTWTNILLLVAVITVFEFILLGYEKPTREI